MSLARISPIKQRFPLKILPLAISLLLMIFVTGWLPEPVSASSVQLQESRSRPFPRETRVAENTAKAEEEQFRQLISEGLAAFHDNNYQLSRTKLLEARSLRPESPEVAEALAQVEEVITLAGIDKLRQEALEAEQSEDWQRALLLYMDALAIDKKLQFAIQGKKRAVQQANLATRIQYVIANPQIMESDEQLNNAILVLREAQEIEPKGPKLAAQTKELEKLIQLAQATVTITIESDGLTEIAVYRVGKLGRFSERELHLRPGIYTVLGTRNGYKDFRKKIVVKSSEEPLHITVTCRDEI